MASSVIQEFGYDPSNQRLTVLFVGGRTYAYDKVPPDIAEGLATAASRGRFFNACVRNRYAAVRIRRRAS